MESLEADPEDIREIFHAAKIIRNAITQNNLQIAYVMEALQALYASQARDLVSYEVYCEKIDCHKKSYKQMWDKT